MSNSANPTGRVAFFGGSFDPPHLGHLTIARAASTALGLTRVLFAPVGAQPLKPQGASVSFLHRLQMTGLAIADENGFELSELDAPRPGLRPNYTIESLESIRATLDAGIELFCLMGADSFRLLDRWHRGAESPFAATLVVASRPGEHLGAIADSLPQGVAVVAGSERSHRPEGVALERCRLRNGEGSEADFFLLPELEVEISATEIRRGIAGSNGGRELVKPSVADYIRAHRLYHSLAPAQ